jgi:hypothetical protein
MEHAQYRFYIYMCPGSGEVPVRNLGCVSQAFQTGLQIGHNGLVPHMLQNRMLFMICTMGMVDFLNHG